MKEGTFLPNMETFYMALADKTRLRLLNLMRQSEVSVGFLVEALEESQPKVSRHLAYLRSAGIVQARRDGKWIHYKIVEPEDKFAAGVLSNTLRWLYSKQEMQIEYKKFLGNSTDSFDVATEVITPDLHVSEKAETNEDYRQELEIYLL